MMRFSIKPEEFALYITLARFSLLIKVVFRLPFCLSQSIVSFANRKIFAFFPFLTIEKGLEKEKLAILSLISSFGLL